MAPALEAYSDLERRLGLIEVQDANRLADTFIIPMQQFVVDLDAILPSFTSYKKSADDAYPLILSLRFIYLIFARYNEYVSGLGKLLNASKSKADPKKAMEAEKEVQLKKRQLDIQAGEFASRLRSISDKKEGVQWALLRAMRSQTEALASGVDRSQALIPAMDNLECGLREKIRKEYGQQLAASILTELASLPADFSAESDSVLLNESMRKLDDPYVLGEAGPNYVPLVDLLASPGLHMVNSLVTTAEEDQENVIRSVVRVLDAYQKCLPLIKVLAAPSRVYN